MKKGIAMGTAALMVLMAIAVMGGKAAAETGDGDGVLHVPGEYADLQTAIDAADAGDTIVLAPGVHYPPATVDVTTSVTILGPQAGSHPLPSRGSSRTPGDSLTEAIIDGSMGGLSKIIYIDADNVVLDGLEVRSGSGDLIRQSNTHSGTTVRNCIINDATGDEGIQLANVVDGLVECNYVFDIAQDGINNAGALNSVIRNNEVTQCDSENGAIFVYDSVNVVVEHNYIHHNTANNGIKLYTNDGDICVRNNLIADNEWYLAGKHAAYSGNAVLSYKGTAAGATVTIEHNTIACNSMDPASPYPNGAMKADGTPATPIPDADFGNAICINTIPAYDCRVDIANNIMAGQDGWGVITKPYYESWGPGPSPGNIVAGYNDLFNNMAGDVKGVVTMGPGNLLSDPMFDAGYGLLPGSPCTGTGGDGEDMGVMFDEWGCKMTARELKEAALDALAEIPYEEIECKGVASLTLKYNNPGVKNYGDMPLSGGFPAGHFEDVYDLTMGDVTLSFIYDANGLVDDLGGIAHAWATLGIREVGYPDFNPTWMTGGAGVWLATDYDWGLNTFDPDAPGSPSQDLDDKLILQRGGGMDESHYDLPIIPPNPWANHAFWFDRDGVDQWQAQMWGAIDGVTYNTGGIYTVTLDFHAVSATSGTAYMTINGQPQGFYAPNWHPGPLVPPVDLFPAGMTFTGDMTNMQVFYGLYGYGATHSVAFNAITATQTGDVVEVTSGGSFGPQFVDYEEEFTVLPEDGKDKLGGEVKIMAGGVETKIHTSGSQDLEEGMIFGDFEVTGVKKIWEYKRYKEIDKAMEHIEKSLDEKYWLDDNTLDPKDGKKVFDEEKKAVEELMKACKCEGLSSLEMEYTGGPTELDYDDQVLYQWQSGNMADTFDLTQGDLTLSYTVDMSTIANAGWALVEVGLREVGYGNLDPNLVGGWMQSNYNFGTSNPGSLNDNDMHLLSKHGWLYQNYDATDPETLVAPYWSGANHGFWFDRDGVDQYQAAMWGMSDGGTYNTGGVYEIEINYHAISPTQATMFATINGVQQGIYVGGYKNAQPEYYPMGRSFDGDMTRMQLFFGRGGGGGYVTLSDIEMTYDAALIEVTEGGAFGPQWVGVKETFEILPPEGKDKLGKDTTALVNGVEVEVPTSCSEPIDAGFEYGCLKVAALDRIYENEYCPEYCGLIQSAIDALVEADRLLAEAAHEEALGYAGDDKVDKELEKCEDELEKAQDELDEWDYDKAIDHYRKAWDHAQKAIEHGT